MNRSQKQLALLLSLFFMQFQLNGQVVENYDGRLAYAKQPGWFQSSEIIQVSLDLRTFSTASFMASVPAESTVFLENILWFYTANDTSVTISIESLKADFGFEKDNKINFSVLRKGIKSTEVSIKKGFFSKDSFFVPVEEIHSSLQFQAREINRFYSFYFLALIFILFFLAIYKSMYPSVMRYILNPKSIFSTEDFSEINAIQKFFSLDILFFILILNLAIALITMVGIKEIGFLGTERFAGVDVGELFLYWLLLTLGLFVSTIIKFLFIKFMTIIYELRKNDFSHFFYLLRVVSVLIIFLLLIISIYTLNRQEELSIVLNWSFVSFFWLYLVAVLLLLLIMMNRVPFNNYHLFAYICTAELIPFLIIVKIMIGLGFD